MLNDSGLYGVCESDLQSTMTQLLITGYSAKPGFVSDPTFDTSRNEVIHAHCVAATRTRGVAGPASPYILRSHMEDNKGVSVQVEMPVRETITCAKFADPRTLLVSTGEVTGNIDGSRGCRTKMVTRVADARKLVEGWSAGLHRVIFYGDHIEAAQRMGRLLGFKVFQEG
jgi:L-fucose isomerase-like protein